MFANNNPHSFIDIGVNLMSPAFDHDREAVLAGAETAGVKTLIITGSSIASSAEALAFAQTHPQCKTTAGVHPHNAKDWDTAALPAARLQELLAQESPVSAPIIAAIGECGLDYNRNFSPPQEQRKCFEDQLMLAALLGKPVFLHERDAFDDFLSILKRHRTNLPGAVVHCFTGGAAELEAWLALDCYIGITGWICDERRNTHLIPLLRHIPADRLLLETDAPYLLPRNLPRSLRGKSGRNESCFLPHIAAFAAEILGKTPEQLAAETSANAARLFNL
ncbi:MAG: TatD family hydrolase [Treponema sp.]|jgi:TatD DNase family protein|nr:TatD family hydrolase [Treponema sp.]